MLKKIKRYLRNPYNALGDDLIKKHPNWMSDKYYLSVLWRMIMGYDLNWHDPHTFNEKLQYLKLNDHNPIYPILVDKYRVKEWVSQKIGSQHVIPTLATYSNVDEIDINSLPNQFVLKCNHDSGSVIICRDKTTFDFDSAKKKLSDALKHNFYWDAREWAYKHVNRLVFAEEYKENTISKDLLTYKFLCFDGEPIIVYVTVKNEHIFENYYDMDFQPLDIHRNWPNSGIHIPRPSCFEEMKRIAAELSKGLAHVRMDLYEINGQVYFSEYTFYDWGGLIRFHPDHWDKELGGYIQLNK